MTEEEVLKVISAGEHDTFDLLNEADPNLIKRFNRVDKSIVKLLNDVKNYFPDATYYTASGGFHLMLGEPHSPDGSKHEELIAISGTASIGDGDF